MTPNYHKRQQKSSLTRGCRKEQEVRRKARRETKSSNLRRVHNLHACDLQYVTLTSHSHYLTATINNTHAGVFSYPYPYPSPSPSHSILCQVWNPQRESPLNIQQDVPQSRLVMTWSHQVRLTSLDPTMINTSPTQMKVTVKMET